NVGCAEMSSIVDHYRCAGDCHPANAGDICVRLRSCRADAYGVRLTSNPCVADVDVVIARGEPETSSVAQCGVVAAGSVVIERTRTIGRVVITSCIVVERKKTTSRVVIAGYVVSERNVAIGRVAAAICVACERICTIGCVGVAGALLERPKTSGCI